MITKLKLIPLIAACALTGCTGLYGNDEMERYFQRADKMTMSGGEANQVNAAGQVLNPWPPGVTDRRIVSDGTRAASAVERYKKGMNPPDPLPKARDNSPPPLGAELKPNGATSNAPTVNISPAPSSQ